jgi:NAD(P)-dependent dehydrogenase (short-subunit alcohol dehydrogenase family)
MTPPGLRPPPPVGASALATGTYDGRVVIVTGGGTGLGKAIATEFARLGASVGILSRNDEHRAAGVAAVEGAGGRAAAARCDIRDPESIAVAFDQVGEELGPIDVLVNNAAGNFPVPAEDMSPNAWRTVVDIVLNGTFYCCRDLARRLIPEGRDGSIVNVGASYAWTGGPGFAHSAAAKAGVKNLTETLAVGWDSPASWPGPPPTSAPPTPPTSAATRWWWTEPTGSVVTRCNPRSPRSGSSWTGRRSASPASR